MEEKKVKKENEAPERMSYEQLNNIAHQLSEQNRQLYMKLQEANLANMKMRLDFLFKVVENFEMFTPEFSEKCVKEIEELMTLPEEEEKKEEEEEK